MNAATNNAEKTCLITKEHSHYMRCGNSEKEREEASSSISIFRNFQVYSLENNFSHPLFLDRRLPFNKLLSCFAF